MEQPKPTQDSEEIKDYYSCVIMYIKNNVRHMEEGKDFEYCKISIERHNNSITKLLKE